jgi:uncharacterized protein (UPF0264 family)
MTQLLVSVRSALEADIALAGGADVIDIKEPARGSLGRADDAVLLEVQTRIAGRRPLSAALGELTDNPAPAPSAFRGFVKLGLAQTSEPRTKRSVVSGGQDQPLILAAYADWQRAEAPPPEVVVEMAIAHHCPGLLIDTWQKDGTRLLDWLSLAELDRLRKLTLDHGLFLALAGSLRLEEIPTLLPIQPDLLAFRAAACGGRSRIASISQEAVSRLADAIHAPSRKLTNSTSFSLATAVGNQRSTSPSLAQSAGPVP